MFLKGLAWTNSEEPRYRGVYVGDEVDGDPVVEDRLIALNSDGYCFADALTCKGGELFEVVDLLTFERNDSVREIQSVEAFCASLS